MELSNNAQGRAMDEGAPPTCITGGHHHRLESSVAAPQNLQAIDLARQAVGGSDRGGRAGATRLHLVDQSTRSVGRLNSAHLVRSAPARAPSAVEGILEF